MSLEHLVQTTRIEEDDPRYESIQSEVIQCHNNEIAALVEIRFREDLVSWALDERVRCLWFLHPFLWLVAMWYRRWGPMARLELTARTAYREKLGWLWLRDGRDYDPAQAKGADTVAAGIVKMPEL